MPHLAALENQHHRWIRTTRSTGGDATEAGRRSALDVLAGGADPKLLVAFCSDDMDLEAFAAAVDRASGGVPLVGCSTAGELSAEGPTDGGSVLVAFGGPGFSVTTSVTRSISDRLHAAGAEAAAAALPDRDRAHRILLLLTDGLAGDQQEIVRGAYSVTGSGIPLVGGCAGDELRMRRTRQIFGAEVLTDAIVAVGLASDAPLGIGVHHGWEKVGEAMVVTASAGTRVLSLDDRPALDVYLDRLDAPAGARIDPDAFTQFSLTHPLGLDRRSGDEVRFVAGADFEERSLLCIAEVPQGGLAHFMRGDAASVLTATLAACDEAIDGLAGAPAIGMLAFDCIARRRVLGPDGIAGETDAIRTRADGAPFAGFYTYGEIARTKGMRGFHNQTLVVLAVA
jgi:hypothetical protein